MASKGDIRSDESYARSGQISLPVVSAARGRAASMSFPIRSQHRLPVDCD
jgi:hypothetical protein